MKKLVKSISLVLIIAMLASCSGEKKNDSKKIKVLNIKPEINEILVKYAKEYSAKNNVEVEIETCGGSCKYGEKLDGYITAGNTPDVFIIEGAGDFSKYKEIAADLSNEEFVKDTDYAFTFDGKVYGFPIGLEGYGLTYNKDILDKAGIDVATLTSYDAYSKAFSILESKKDELGITASVAMAAGSESTWVTGLHAFNNYLSNGLEHGDKSIVELLNSGKVDENRLKDYSDMIELIFNNSDKTVLNDNSSSSYGNQVKLFTDKKVAFLHQGSWAAGDIDKAGLSNIGIAPAPYGSNAKVLAGANYFVINKESKNYTDAMSFIDSFRTDKAGQSALYEEAKSITPFKSVSITPSSPLALSIFEADKAGMTSSWNQYEMPADFGMRKLGPIHTLFANGQLNKEQFKEQVVKTIAELKK